MFLQYFVFPHTHTRCKLFLLGLELFLSVLLLFPNLQRCVLLFQQVHYRYCKHASDRPHQFSIPQSSHAHDQVLELPLLVYKDTRCKLFLLNLYLLPLLQPLQSIRQRCALPYCPLRFCVHKLPHASGMFHHISILLKNCVRGCQNLSDSS